MQDLERIAAFGVFFDFLENPSKYKQIVEDSVKAAKESKAIIEKQRKIKNIDEWKTSEELEYSRRFDELESQKAANLKKTEAFKEKAASHELYVSETNKALANRASELDAREAAVSKLEKEMAKLKKLQQESINERNKLQAERDHLKKQTELIKAATGGL